MRNYFADRDFGGREAANLAWYHKCAKGIQGLCDTEPVQAAAESGNPPAIK